MGFRIGNLKTLNYESRLDPMTDEGHLRPFYGTSFDNSIVNLGGFFV